MSDAVTPEIADDSQKARKAWVTPAIIVGEARATEGHNSRFTDGTSPGGITYGS